jgi:hypothetical protein
VILLLISLIVLGGALLLSTQAKNIADAAKLELERVREEQAKVLRSATELNDATAQLKGGAHTMMARLRAVESLHGGAGAVARSSRAVGAVLVMALLTASCGDTYYVTSPSPVEVHVHDCCCAHAVPAPTPAPAPPPVPEPPAPPAPPAGNPAPPSGTPPNPPSLPPSTPPATPPAVPPTAPPHAPPSAPPVATCPNGKPNDGDCNNGHGNDPGRVDTSNPGKGKK